LLVLSTTCFSYLTLYGTESVYVASTIDYNVDMQSSSMSNVNGMKHIIVKILKIMMLKF
jgi:hypothetical protein